MCFIRDDIDIIIKIGVLECVRISAALYNSASKSLFFTRLFIHDMANIKTTY